MQLLQKTAGRQSLSQEILAHTLKSVAAAPSLSDPFPHVIVPNLFPSRIYQEMLELLPEQSAYETFAYEKHSTDGESNRFRFSLKRQSIDRLSPRKQVLWSAIRDVFRSPQLKDAMFGKVKKGLAYRYGISEEKVSDLGGFALPELFRETKGYSIKPHPDTRRKVVTMQIALPADDSQKDLGTEFYRMSINPLNLLREPRGFEIVKRTPFLPNTGYAFSVLNTIRMKSWHGRTAISGECGVRNTILNIWYANEADANPDMVEPAKKAA